MKKLVFTALAVVAFSGAAMAKTGVVIETAVGCVLNVEDPDECQKFAMDFIEELDPNNEMSSIDANNAYQDLLDMCYKG